MGNRSWLVTLVPLFMALIGIAYSAATGQQLSAQQIQVIQDLIIAFIGAGGIGAWHSVQKAKIAAAQK